MHIIPTVKTFEVVVVSIGCVVRVGAANLGRSRASRLNIRFGMRQVTTILCRRLQQTIQRSLPGAAIANERAPLPNVDEVHVCSLRIWHARVMANVEAIFAHSNINASFGAAMHTHENSLRCCARIFVKRTPACRNAVNAAFCRAVKMLSLRCTFSRLECTLARKPPVVRFAQSSSTFETNLQVQLAVLSSPVPRGLLFSSNWKCVAALHSFCFTLRARAARLFLHTRVVMSEFISTPGMNSCVNCLTSLVDLADVFDKHRQCTRSSSLQSRSCWASSTPLCWPA
jgi:hypothetical protein